MKKLLITSTVIAFAIFSNSSLLAKSVLEKSLNMQSDDLTSFRVDATAGDLVIEGVEGLMEIQVSAKIHGDNIEVSDYRLELSKQGTQGILVVDIDQGYFSNNRIDILVKVPAQLSLEVFDSSGDIDIESMKGGLTVEDSSGDLDIRDIVGNVEVEDRSGDLSITMVDGQVSLNDRSGDLEVSQVNGNVVVDDRSGDIEIRDIKGTVTVNDSSGDIFITNAEGFDLQEDGSGDLELVNVKRSNK
jgi:hypothetical protein